MSNAAIYLVAAPTALPYFMSFLWVDEKKRLFPYEAQLDENTKMQNSSQPSSSNSAAVNSANNLQASEDQENDYVSAACSVVQGEESLTESGVVDNEALSWINAKRVYSKVGLLITNLALVYFLEYLITTSFTVVSARRIVN